MRIPLIPNRVRPGLCHGQVAYDDLCGAQRPLQQRAGIIKVEYAQVVRKPQHSDQSQPSRNPIPVQRSMPPGFRPAGFRPPGAVAGPVGHRPLPHRPQPHHGQLHHPAPVRPASPGPSGSATPSSSWVTPPPPRPCARSSTPPASTPAPQTRHRRGLAQVPRHSRLGAGVTPHGPRLSAALRSVRLAGTAHGGVALQIPSGRCQRAAPIATPR